MSGAGPGMSQAFWGESILSSQGLALSDLLYQLNWGVRVT